MPSSASSSLRFARFEIRPAERVLSVDGEPAPVGARAFDLLLVLVAQRDRVVGKQELLDAVWPGLVVEEHNIAAQISTLRKLLGAQAIATVPGRGYRFTAVPEEAGPTPTPTPTSASVLTSPPRGNRQSLRHNLPEPRTRFIGRDAALADLARLVPQSRLLTLTGLGGSGKTRLALQFASTHLPDFPDGAWFVDLQALREDDRVAGACATVLGLDAGARETLTERLAAHLAERRALIVLDNCEQVLRGAAALVDALLARAGPARILVTSREPLAVAGEQLYPVRPLSLPATSAPADLLACDAVRVFVDRARLVAPAFEAGPHNAVAMGEICRRLDGIALAIELAAARVPMLSVDDIAARLSDRFRLLTGGAGPALRHQTLLATMQWSHDQLVDDERRMLRAAATFAGGWTIDAARAVAPAADDYEALAWLTALHDKSLIVVDEAAGAPRYRMLETVREYAERQLQASGDAAGARQRHALHFLALAEAAAPHLESRAQPAWMARLFAEQENLVAALRWFCGPGDDRSAALRLAAATVRYWIFHDIDLGSQLAEAAIAADRGAGPGTEGVDDARFSVHYGLSALHMHRRDADGARAHAEAALAIALASDSQARRSLALNAIGNALATAADADGALARYEEAAVCAQSCGDQEQLAKIANNIGEIERARGRHALAEQRYRQALDVHRANGNALSAAIVLHNLIRVMAVDARRAEGCAFADESDRLLAATREDVLRFELLKATAGLAAACGEHLRAVRWWSAGELRFVDAGYHDSASDRAQMAALLAASRRVLGDGTYQAAEKAGRSLRLDAAMDELRQWVSACLRPTRRSR